MIFKWKEIVLILTGMLINFYSATCYSYMTPFYPPYAEERGISPVWYSLVGGLGDGMYIITLICNRIYRSVCLKKMVWYSLIIQTLAAFCFGFTNYIDDDNTFIAVCVILRIITGLSLTNLTLSSFSMIILTLYHRKAIVMSYFEVAFSIGMIFGPTMGGFFFHYTGYTVSFIILASVNLIVIVMVAITFRNLKIELKKEDAIDVSKLLLHPLIQINMIEIIFISFIFAFMNNLLSPYLEITFEIDSLQIGIIYALGGFVQAFSQAFTGKLLDRNYQIYKLNFCGMLFAMIGLFFLCPQLFTYRFPLLWVTVISMMILMWGIGMKFLTNTFELVPIITEMGFKEDNIFVYISVYMLMYTSISIGILAGSIGNGKLKEMYGFEATVFGLFSFLLFMWIISRSIYFVVSYRRKDKKGSLSETTPLISSCTS